MHGFVFSPRLASEAGGENPTFYGHLEITPRPKGGAEGARSKGTQSKLENIISRDSSRRRHHVTTPIGSPKYSLDLSQLFAAPIPRNMTNKHEAPRGHERGDSGGRNREGEWGDITAKAWSLH